MMLSYREASFEDVRSILSNVSDVTKSELDVVRKNVEVEELAKALFSSGPSDISFFDETPLFIVGHYPVADGLRGTWCFAGKAVETFRRETMMAAVGQVERMLVNFPHSQFTSVSYSRHPRRDWFFAAMGFHKRMDLGDGAVFDLLPIVPAPLDS